MAYHSRVRTRLLTPSLVTLFVLASCTPFEGDGTGASSTGVGAAGTSSSTSASNGGTSSSTSSGSGGMGPKLETITVVDAKGTPQPGLTVFSAHADGSADQTLTTDASGTVMVDIPTGGSVSLADPDAMRLVTYFGVGDGASARFVRAPVRANPNPAKNVSVTNPSSGAALVEYGQSCDPTILSVPGTQTANLSASGCPGQATYDVVAVGLGSQALPNNIGALQYVGVKSNISYANGTIGTIALSPATVTWAQGVATVPGSAQFQFFTVTGRRAGIPTYHRVVPNANGQYIEMPGNGVFSSFDMAQRISFPSSAGATVTWQHVEHTTALAPAQSQPTMVTLLPPPKDPSATAPNSDFNAGKWSYALTGAPFADAVVLEAIGGTQNPTWTVLTPPEQMAMITVPTVPAAFSSLKPSTSAFIYLVRHVDDEAASYAEVLTRGWLFDDATFTESYLRRVY